MSYDGICVKHVVEKINKNHSGWYLPATQRPYVWGSRYESEKHICKLFDSILNGYPIGSLIVWTTDEKIGYREFLTDYEDTKDAKLVEEGLWDKPGKGLIYDGQQRLQTLYSCLKYTFNDKILCFDLLYCLDEVNEYDKTGFSFFEKGSKIKDNFVKLNKIFSRDSKEKVDFRRSIFKRKNWSKNEEKIIEDNLDDLWKIFVETDKKSLAYFPIDSNNEDEVNEIFQRLNSGGYNFHRLIYYCL
jgi:uncharacterized protein with ParB-like and HNH nuclease domain